MGRTKTIIFKKNQLGSRYIEHFQGIESPLPLTNSSINNLGREWFMIITRCNQSALVSNKPLCSLTKSEYILSFHSFSKQSVSTYYVTSTGLGPEIQPENTRVI